MPVWFIYPWVHCISFKWDSRLLVKIHNSNINWLTDWFTSHICHGEIFYSRTLGYILLVWFLFFLNLMSKEDWIKVTVSDPRLITTQRWRRGWARRQRSKGETPTPEALIGQEGRSVEIPQESNKRWDQTGMRKPSEQLGLGTCCGLITVPSIPQQSFNNLEGRSRDFSEVPDGKCKAHTI